MDQMFSSFGLDSFLTQSPEKKPDNGSELGGVTSPTTASTNLSLQDKQRMVKQQEQQNSAQKAAGPLKLQQKPFQNKQPRDLTATLMEANLSQIKSPTTSSVSNYWGSLSSGSSQVNNSASTNWNNSQGSSSLNWHNSNFSSSNAGMGTMTSTGGGQQWSSASQNNGNNNNWSALDNLLPAKQNKVPMNQMSQPLIAAPSQQSSQGAQSNQLLSSQDIMEFLG